MSQPTAKEKAWMKKIEKLLMNPPSDRLGLYTIGDNCLTVYDKTYDKEITDIQDAGNDFCQAVHELDVELGNIDSATSIHSTAG